MQSTFLLCTTPSLPKYSAYKFFQESNDVKFDQVCREKKSTSRVPLDFFSLFIAYREFVTSLLEGGLQFCYNA
jgi:hypothetical protein